MILSIQGRQMSSTIELMSTAQSQALLELGRRGAGGRFDQEVMSQLFTMGLIEVRNEDRRLALTKLGRKEFLKLTGQL